ANQRRAPPRRQWRGARLQPDRSSRIDDPAAGGDNHRSIFIYLKQRHSMSIIELAMRAAREAGAILQDFATRGFQVTHKGRINLLTEADLASERHIKQLITEHFPTHRIIAEESWDGTHDV